MTVTDVSVRTAEQPQVPERKDTSNGAAMDEAEAERRFLAEMELAKELSKKSFRLVFIAPPP